jgi:hypothetical protein
MEHALAFLQGTASALAAIYNGILAYDYYTDRKPIWRVLASGFTALFVAYFAYYRFRGLISN